MSDILDSNTNYNAPKENVPNAGGVLTMGIISIVFAGIIGLILSIISLSLASKSRQMYFDNPERYNESSFKQLNAGRVCAIIGISISGLALLIILMAVAANA